MHVPVLLFIVAKLSITVQDASRLSPRSAHAAPLPRRPLSALQPHVQQGPGRLQPPLPGTLSHGRADAGQAACRARRTVGRSARGTATAARPSLPALQDTRAGHVSRQTRGKFCVPHCCSQYYTPMYTARVRLRHKCIIDMYIHLERFTSVE